MQAVKVTLLGGFWDTQIYSGYLYLFDDLGDITVLNWDFVIDSLLKQSPDLLVAAQIAFQNSNLLYTKGAKLLFSDPQIKKLLLEKFERLASMELEISKDGLNGNYIKYQDNPFPFPHTDSEIYYRQMFVGLKSGLYSTECDGGNSMPVASKIDKRWDAPIFDITASGSYTTLALATGGDGLFEVKVTPRYSQEIKEEPHIVASNHCTACDWTYYSIYASSHARSAFMAAFSKVKSKNGSTKKYMRKFDKVISSDDLFRGGGFSWGGRDKLYQYRDGIIDVIRYNPEEKNENGNWFHQVGEIRLAEWKGDVVSASVAPFGTIIECDNAIVVAQSDGENITIPGEPVRWRIFPKTKHYKNQLHIIYDDRLEIWSFNHDYFVDQNAKMAGMQMSF